MDNSNHTQLDTEATPQPERRPFVEPALTPAGDMFEVTKNFLFMMMQSGFSGNGDEGDA
jgi:hypothetical protein